MDIYYKNIKLNNLEDLQSRTNKWEEGRSAATLGRFIFEHNGIEQIESIVSDILKNINITPLNWNPNVAIFEHESKFDKLGKGRMHDLALFGNTNNGKEIFVGVEAKVNDSFNSRDIQSAYLSGMLEHVNNRKSNIISRIEDLIRRNNFKEQKRKKESKTTNKFSKEQLNLKYQLLYSTIGTAVEDADICILLVLVFKTDLYKEKCGADNYSDYIAFMNAITSKRISDDMDLRSVEVFTDAPLENKKTIYAAYEYISAKGWNK